MTKTSKSLLRAQRAARAIALGLACLIVGLALPAAAKHKQLKAGAGVSASSSTSDEDVPPPSAAAGADAATLTVTPKSSEAASGAGASSGTPAAQTNAPDAPADQANEATVAVNVTPAENEKIGGLKKELTTLMDDLVQARSRATIVGKTLFKTRIVVRVQNLAAPDPVLAKIVVLLDGAPVFHGDASSLGDDDTHQVFDGFAAPGPHVLGIEVEQRSRDDADFGYTLRNDYRVQLPREKQTELTLIIDDDSNLADDFPDDGDGEYDVRTRLRQKTQALGTHKE